MSDQKLSTDSYKGVRDFYPADMAIQRYIFETWAKTAESFGFERYDASILEPSDLYKAKGAENEEMVNEQTYTFTDRGEREVTLRPEMTPTVARMVAAKRRELAFPLRWYSIPNLFRYERPQRGRLREHWQLNCDMFGSDHYSADVEIIALAYQTLINFGAKPEMFEIRVNDAFGMQNIMTDANYFGLSHEKSLTLKRLTDRKNKMSSNEFYSQVKIIFDDNEHKTELYIESIESTGNDYFDWVAKNAQNPLENPLIHTGYINASNILHDLHELGITNAKFDPSIARGFDYYTGTIFEIFEVDADGNSTGRAMLGGGRYDNLTSMFGGEPISGVGFGMGDVTMRDFLETHNLLPAHLASTAAKVAVIPMTTEQNLFAEKVAMAVRRAGHTVSTDIGTQKVDKKKARASERGSQYIVVVGEDEAATGQLTLKNLHTGEEMRGQLADIVTKIV